MRETIFLDEKQVCSVMRADYQYTKLLARPKVYKIQYWTRFHITCCDEVTGTDRGIGPVFGAAYVPYAM
jgi:hypothetical protein